ncbi:hypothetical protein [Helicobacter sp. T3_23-1059]
MRAQYDNVVFPPPVRSCKPLIPTPLARGGLNYIISPSRAEWARGWVFLDFTAVIVDFFVIASGFWQIKICVAIHDKNLSY